VGKLSALCLGLQGSPQHTFTACVLLPTSVSDGRGGRAPSTIFRYSSDCWMLIQSNIVNCVSRSRDSIPGRLSQTAFSNVVGLCGVGVTAFVDVDAARAAPMRASCSILPARPRSRENHARTLFHGCDASLEASEEAGCGTESTVSIFGGGGKVGGGSTRKGDGESSPTSLESMRIY
jgi:hypothetical protein